MYILGGEKCIKNVVCGLRSRGSSIYSRSRTFPLLQDIFFLSVVLIPSDKESQIEYLMRYTLKCHFINFHKQKKEKKLRLYQPIIQFLIFGAFILYYEHLIRFPFDINQ